MTKFTKPIAEILARAAGQKRTITYGAIIADLKAQELPLAGLGIGRQLVAVHRVIQAQAQAAGLMAPPLTAIAVAADGEPGNGLAPVLAEWLSASGAFPAMIRDAEAAAASGAAAPPHVLRFTQTQVQAFDGWADFLASIPDVAFVDAAAGHHSEIEV
jgi:hypothetical protein